jgi:hypothetical protein
MQFRIEDAKMRKGRRVAVTVGMRRRLTRAARIGADRRVNDGDADKWIGKGPTIVITA